MYRKDFKKSGVCTQQTQRLLRPFQYRFETPRSTLRCKSLCEVVLEFYAKSFVSYTLKILLLTFIIEL